MEAHTRSGRNTGIRIGAGRRAFERALGFAGILTAGLLAAAVQAEAASSDSKTGLVPAYPEQAKCRTAKSFFGDRYSMRPAVGDRIARVVPHKGLDIPAPVGTKVRAAAAGTVERVFRTKREGAHIVFVDAQKRNRMVYAHVDPVVRPFETVKKGQVIAFVSFYKSPVGPHLHWSTRSIGAGKSELVDSLSLFPVDGKSAKIAYIDEQGKTHPPGAGVIWPFPCNSVSETPAGSGPSG